MNETPKPPSRSKLAVAALILAIVGLCVFPVGLVGAVLGAVALYRISKDRTLGGKNLAIASLVLVPVSCFTIGIVAAVAIPAFINYVKRSKTAEVHANVPVLYAGVESYVDEHEGSLPPAIGPVPAEPPSAMKRVWSEADRAAFAPVHFSPTEATYYVYSVVPDPDGRGVTIVAEGDLDEDGIRSRFALHAILGADGRLSRDAGVVIDSELE